MKKYLLGIIILLGFSPFISNISPVHAQDFQKPIVESLSEFQTKGKLTHTIQAIPLHVAAIQNFIFKNQSPVTSMDVMHSVYPNIQPSELANMTADFDDSLTYFKHQSIKFTKVNGIPDYHIIVNELRAKRPLLIQLRANVPHWLEPESALLLYGVQVFPLPDGSANILYICRSLNHIDQVTYSGGGERNFNLLANEKGQDPTIGNITYSWVGTAYGFSK